MRRSISSTDLIGNVVDGDVMHGCSVTLEESVEVGPTVPEKYILHETCYKKGFYENSLKKEEEMKTRSVS